MSKIKFVIEYTDELKEANIEKIEDIEVFLEKILTIHETNKTKTIVKNRTHEDGTTEVYIRFLKEKQEIIKEEENVKNVTEIKNSFEKEIKIKKQKNEFNSLRW